MKILMLIPSDYIKGDQSFSTLIKNEIEGLQEADVDVVKYYYTNRKSLSHNLQVRKEIKLLLKSTSIKVIHVQTGTAMVPLFFLRIKKPILLTIGGSELLGYPGQNFGWWLRGQLARITTILASMRATKIICVSENLRKSLPKFLQKKAFVQARGINTEVYKPLNLSNLRHQLEWTHNGKYVVFSYANDSQGVKNIELAEVTINTYQEIYNDDLHFEHIHKKTKEEVVEMLNAADVLLLTSLHEGSPNIVKEAMACNLPIVTVNCGDVKERLNGVENCYISDKYDENKLAELLHKVFANNNRSNGRDKLFSDRIDLHSTSEHLKIIYQDLASKYIN